MSINGSSHYKISQKIEDGLRFLGSAVPFFQELKEAVLPYWFKTVSKATTHFRKIGSKLTGWDFFWGFLSTGIVFICFLIIFCGFCVLGYQTINWLQNGVWEEISLLIAFNFLFEGASIHDWIIAPDSWLGLHQIVSWALKKLPLSLVLIINGTFLTLSSLGVIGIAASYRYYQLSKL